jgi:hypothetical protein
MTKAIWISFDLGIEGDYKGLYKWLDKNNALECGDNFAYFKKNLTSSDDIPRILKAEIKEDVSIKKGDRIYVIYRNIDKKVKGDFIFGGRKRSPWEGFSNIQGINTTDILEDE